MVIAVNFRASGLWCLASEKTTTGCENPFIGIGFLPRRYSKEETVTLPVTVCAMEK